MPSELPLWLSSPIYMLAFSRVTQSETLLGFETEKSERPGVGKVEGTWDREMLMPLFSSCAMPVLAKSSVAQPKFHPATCCMKFILFEFVLCFMNQGENNLNFQCRIVYTPLALVSGTTQKWTKIHFVCSSWRTAPTLKSASYGYTRRDLSPVHFTCSQHCPIKRERPVRRILL